MVKNRLSRSVNDRIFGGVCGGIAEYINFPSWIIRILAVVLCFLPFGIIIVPLIYLILLAKLPSGMQKKKNNPNTIDVEYEVKE